MDGLATTGIGVNVVGVDYKILQQSKLLIDRFGDLTGKLCYKNYMGLDIPCDSCPMAAAIKSGKVERAEMLGSDGRHYEIFSAALPSSDGGIDKAIEVVLDITERKQSEEALRESEEKYRNILDSIEDGYFEVDIAGDFTFLNDSLIKNLGYPQNEAMGMNSRRYTDEENAKKLYKTFNKVYTTGKPDKGFDWEIIRKDGSKRYVEASVSLRKDAKGRPIGFQGIVRDITERKQSEEALRESEEKYRNILDSIEDGYFEVDIAGDFTFFNQSLCNITGYTADELMGSNNRQYMDEKNAKKMYRSFNIVFKTGKTTKLTEVEFFRKDGSTCTIEMLVSLVKGEDGKPAGFRGSARDITERKKAEEEKANLEHQLRQAQKMETIGTLVGGVAHDLNNVLSGIVGYPDLLLMKLPENSPLRKPILTIQESGEKAAAIVQDLLTLARRGVSIQEALNFNAVISEYLESPEYKKIKSFYPDVEVETNLESDLLNILGSPVHLSKIVMNLVSNSAEAIGEKGKISIATENRYIDSPIRGYETVEEGDSVILTVSDSGTGISPGDIERIFEPFYTKKKMGKSGTGLGLSVVWGTVKDHKGYIDVQSAEGKGTTFTLYFPVTRQEPAQGQVDLSIEDYMGKGQSVLVVDDVKEQRELVSAMLKMLGYSVATAPSGEEAVDYLQNNPADLLILDMIMAPGMDGLDTYRQVLKLHPGQKAIIASGYSETDRVKEVQRLGAGHYIRKPYTLEKIGLAVKKELG
jgi:PAS domain S-box-containing protein